MATKKAEPNTIEIDGETLETITVTHAGTDYVIRELTVKENDTIEDASRKADGTFDGRLNLRMCLAAALVSPQVSVDSMDKWGGKKYVVLSRGFNKVNTVADEAGVPNG